MQIRGSPNGAHHSPPHFRRRSRSDVVTCPRRRRRLSGPHLGCRSSAPDQRVQLRSVAAVPSSCGRHLETFPNFPDVHYGRSGTGALAPTVVGTHSRGHLDRFPSLRNSVPSSNRSARAPARKRCTAPAWPLTQRIHVDPDCLFALSASHADHVANDELSTPHAFDRIVNKPRDRG
jgi:hypothetical protein